MGVSLDQIVTRVRAKLKQSRSAIKSCYDKIMKNSSYSLLRESVKSAGTQLVNLLRNDESARLAIFHKDINL